MTSQSIEQAIQLARQHHQAGRLHEAEEIYRQVLAVQPQHADALHLLGAIAFQVGQPDAAIDLIRRAISLNPAAFDFHFNLGQMLLSLGRANEAIPAFERVVQLQPSHVEAWHSLGNALQSADRFDESMAAYRQSIALDPKNSAACNNLGGVLQNKHRVDEAIDAYRQSLALDPTPPIVHFNLAQALLLNGDFAHAWPEFEHRRHAPELDVRRLDLPHPRWNGEDLHGRSILLHAEQGLGDTIQFVRYAPLVAERGGKVIVACQPELTTLLRRMPRIDQVVTQGDAVSNFDMECPLLSCPMVFKTTLETIPHSVPYLTADPQSAAQFKSFLPTSKRLKIGLAWAGLAQQKNDRNRSMPFKFLAPLIDSSDAQFISLQTGPASQQARESQFGMKLLNLTDQLHNFSDTAALIDNLDLVITVDTSVAHLAGAMGKQVWVLLAFMPDWRWLLKREDSPWYPTMKLFRQSRPGDWHTPIEQVAASLRQFADPMRENKGD